VKRRVLSWLALALTAGLLMVIKWLHLGVTHYNWFLIILIVWTLALVLFFRWLGPDLKKE
jgi:hypothetical protein